MWWALELNNVALWVPDIDGRAFSLCTIPRLQYTRFHSIGVEVAANGDFVEWIDADAEVIEVPAFLPGWCAPGDSEFAIHGDEVNQRAASTKLNQADEILSSLNRASEDHAVEVKHLVEIDNAQHQMIDFPNMDHAR